jgi:hypothetical protein
MAKRKISFIARLHKELHYDPKTGQFRWLNLELNRRADNRKRSDRAGYADGKYVRITFEGTLYLAHRLAFLLMTGHWPHEVDHIDGNGLNNKWSNLRDVTHSENLINRKQLSSNNTSGVRGVFWNITRGQWSVRFCDKHLGWFSTKAAAVRCAKAARSGWWP